MRQIVQHRPAIQPEYIPLKPCSSNMQEVIPIKREIKYRISFHISAEDPAGK
jgi:hypothetical protein